VSIGALKRVFLVLGERMRRDSRKEYQDVDTRMPSTAMLSSLCCRAFALLTAEFQRFAL
jgi:hypothetical protein